MKEQHRSKKQSREQKKIMIKMLISFSNKIRYDHVSSFAGHAALFIIMSLFPMMMYFFSVFKYLPFDTAGIVGDVLRVIPNSVVPLVQEIVREAQQGSSATLKSVTMIVTLVCAARGVYAIIIGMNAVYGIRETRNFFMIYAFAVVYVMAFFAMIGMMMLLIVFGNQIYGGLVQFIPELENFKNVFSVGKYVGLLVILLLFFLLIYMNVPNRKSKIHFELPGALFSTVVWLIFSALFSFYNDNYANYSVTYGSLATIVIFMLWLYVTMNIVFIGAEINVVFRKFAEYGYNYKRAFTYYVEEYQGDLP